MQPDEHESEHPEHRADQPQVEAGLEPVAGVVPEPEPAQNQEASSDEAPAPSNLRRRVDDIRHRIKWLFLLNLIVAIGTMLQAYFACVGTRQTQAALEQNERQHKAIITQAQKLNDDTLAQTERLTNAGLTAQESIATEQLTAATKAAGDELAHQREAIRLERRAWVSVIRTAFESEIVAGKSLVVRVTAGNSGETPALRVRLIERGITLIAPCEPHTHVFSHSRSNFVIPPDSSYSYPLQSVPLDEATAKAIQSDREWFAWGTYAYSDIFEREHITRFCVSYNPRRQDVVKGLGWCGCHNDAT